MAGPSGRRYRASTAQGRAAGRRLRCSRPRLMGDPERRALVAMPAWASTGPRTRYPTTSRWSGQSIYRAVYSGALDCELPRHRKASVLLRRHGKRRCGKSFRERRGKVRIAHDILERPEEASSRRRIGDWEGDTVAGRQGWACLVTQVDRMSGFLVGGKAARKAHAEADEATEKALAGEPVRTITLDRGKEFSDAEGLQGALEAPLLLPPPPPLGAREQREHERAPQGLVPEGHEPRRRYRRRSPEGVRFTQPETAQAFGMEVPLGGLPSPVVALEVRIRH